MPLLDLKTNLKSLKYGQDRPGGGNSGQPYQQVDINKVDSGFNRFRMTKFDDGLVRGGVVGAANASIVDTFRIGKFLTDFPKGPLWLVKQVGLQLANPKLESKKLNTGLPESGQGLFRNIGNFIANTANKIVNAVGPTRIYNPLGLNTLAQVPLNAFGQHLIRHGLLPKMDDSAKYLAVVEANDAPNTNGKNNRLVGLKTQFKLGDRTSSANPQLFNLAARKKAGQIFSTLSALTPGGVATKPKPVGFLDANKELTIDRYIGGAQSVYGIGNTTILRKAFTEDSAKIDVAKNKKHNSATLPSVLIKKTFDFEISNKTTSKYSRETFNLLNFPELGNDRSFIDITASKNDPQKVARPLRILSRDNFINLSTKTSSKFAKFDFPGLNRTINPENILKVTLDKTPKDYKSTLQAGTYTPASIISGSKDTVSKRTNSIFIDAGFPGLGSGSNILSYSKDKTRKDYQPSYFGSKINPTADLGKGSGSIKNYDGKTPEIKIDENAVIYSNPSAKKYSELKAKVDKTTTITQKTPLGAPFTTVPLSRDEKKSKLILKSQFNRTNDLVVDEDTLALVFNPLDPFTGNSLKELKFLGYITDYTENYDSGWSDTKYVGRAESFYIFNSFKRSLNIGFNVPCFTKNELEAKHCALSELASVLAGRYSNGLLGGIITKLKLGGYINNQPGIITNLTFSPIQDSSWDLDAGFAFYLKVSFGFTVIHNFIPQFNPNCGFLKDPPVDKIPNPQPKPKTPDPEPEPTPVKRNPALDPFPIVGTDSTGYRFPGEAGQLQGQEKPQLDAISKRIAAFNPALLGLGG